MMSFAFDRPVGASADVTELDYIAALHQTDVFGGIRKDGSIQGELHGGRHWFSVSEGNFLLCRLSSILSLQMLTLACSSHRAMVSNETWTRSYQEIDPRLASAIVYADGCLFLCSL